VSSYFYCHIRLDGLLYDAECDLLAIAKFFVCFCCLDLSLSAADVFWNFVTQYLSVLSCLRVSGGEKNVVNKITCTWWNVWLEYYVLIGAKRIRVVRPNMRMKNGVVHIIEEVVFDPTDLKTGLSISQASRFVDSVFVIVLSFSSMFIYLRCVFP